ncbi:YbdK family carboxylate-amine ligase, partial [Streptomyces sp. HSW2009]|uniref:carboxylate-amine ligase n=1 Tax=Streptomyces sp. HSW2009 TaxID=3142890 RepID=UPI0032EE8642
MSSRSETQPSMGVEEEFFVVAPGSRAVRPAGVRVVARARKQLEELVAEEFTEYQVEGRTPPCATYDELLAHLLRVRTGLASAAVAEGVRLVPSGTPVLGPYGPAPVLDDARHRLGASTFRALGDDFVLSALHVHVQVPDRGDAVLVGNHLRPWIPLLTAMGANSPYWYGRDTGYASWRTVVKNGWPVSGPPPYFSGLEQYARTVAGLRATGVLVDVGNLFWDVRPCEHLPTVEFRALDVPATAADAAALATLVRALVVA